MSHLLIARHVSKYLLEDRVGGVTGTPIFPLRRHLCVNMSLYKLDNSKGFSKLNC